MKRILIIGASSDLASRVIPELLGEENRVGLHYSKNLNAVKEYDELKNIRLIQKTICAEQDCKEVIEEYITWAGGIDHLLLLMGDINHVCIWSELTLENLTKDYMYNAAFPLLCAKHAVKYMSAGGKILFVSTASAARGGGETSLGYGMGKAAIECATKRLAKSLATKRILVNAIAPGFIDTKFHTDKMGRTEDQLCARAEIVPLKRPGSSKEFASLVLYLLSDGADYITGQVINMDGGDFI